MMHDQISRELKHQLAWLTPDWITNRNPPGPGTYLVTVSFDIHDDGKLSYIPRLEHWDGSRWDTQGAYAQVCAWYYLPQAWQPHDPRCLSLDNILGRHDCDCSESHAV